MLDGKFAAAQGLRDFHPGLGRRVLPQVRDRHLSASFGRELPSQPKTGRLLLPKQGRRNFVPSALREYFTELGPGHSLARLYRWRLDTHRILHVINGHPSLHKSGLPPRTVTADLPKGKEPEDTLAIPVPCGLKMRIEVIAAPQIPRMRPKPFVRARGLPIIYGAGNGVRDGVDAAHGIHYTSVRIFLPATQKTSETKISTDSTEPVLDAFPLNHGGQVVPLGFQWGRLLFDGDLERRWHKTWITGKQIFQGIDFVVTVAL